jgi:micrococcal nuclease
LNVAGETVFARPTRIVRPAVLLVVAVAAAATLAGCRAQPGAAAVPDDGSPAGGPVGTVERIVDGDTLDVRLASGVQRVRLIGIDTPESVKPDAEVECYGVEAAEHLAELLPVGTPVEVVRDVELRDRYGRLLAYVFRQPDELFVNLSMATDGYAAVLTFPPNVTFADDLQAAVAQARRARLGLWRACPDPDGLFG